MSQEQSPTWLSWDSYLGQAEDLVTVIENQHEIIT